MIQNKATMPTRVSIANSSIIKIESIAVELDEMEKELDSLFSKLMPISLVQDIQYETMAQEIKQSPSSDMFSKLSFISERISSLTSRIQRQKESLEV